MSLACRISWNLTSARETISTFTATGVQVNIVSADASQRVLSAAEQAGLASSGDESPLTAVDGPELSQMDHRRLKQAAESATVFSYLTSQQKGQVVDALRSQNELVAMVGDSADIFYYHPTRGGVIAFFTVIVPSLGLTFFASSGRLPAHYMRTRMAHFVIPAAVSMTLAALLISWIFRRNIDDIPYSELVVTHGLILMGLLLIVFVQPPTRLFVGGDVLSGDWPSTYMAIAECVSPIAKGE